MHGAQRVATPIARAIQLLRLAVKRVAGVRGSRHVEGE
jgi:hypothetical protein